MRRLWQLVSVPVLLLVELVGNAGATTKLDQEMREVAREIKQRLKNLPEADRVVALSPFVSPGNNYATGGNYLMQSLKKQLEAEGVKTGDVGFGLSGAFTAEIDEKNKLMFVQVSCTLSDRKGKKLGEELVRGVYGNDDLQFVFPVNHQREGNKVDDRSENLAIQQVVKTPTTTLEGTKVRPERGSEFALELVVAGQKAIPMLKQGMAVVGVKKGQTYVVTFHNDSSNEVAVELLVDGLSAFEFQEDKTPAYKYYIVAPRTSLTIPGWFLKPGKEGTAAFLVTDSADSMVSKHGFSQGAIGTVQARVFYSFKENDDTRGELVRKDTLGTGIGEKRDVKYQVVKRQFGVKTKAEIAVRYTSVPGAITYKAGVKLLSFKFGEKPEFGTPLGNSSPIRADDVILKANGKPVTTVEELQKAIGDSIAGNGKLKLLVLEPSSNKAFNTELDIKKNRLVFESEKSDLTYSVTSIEEKRPGQK